MRKLTSAWLSALLIVGGFLPFGLGAALAQSTVQSAQSPPSGGLEEIVVTAQKRQENVQDVPIAIDAFNSAMLTSMAITNSTQLMQFVPGLTITRANVTSVPFLRGVGNYSGNPGNEPTIATYVDDVYYPAPSGSNYSYPNVERIEVLKGPQGTLFGRNAAGGVISIYTKDPTATPHVDFNVGYANYNTVTTTFYGSDAITDHLVADLSAYYENQSDGWGKHVLTGLPVYLSREWSGRTKWVLTPSDDWKFRFIADYDRVRSDLSSVLNIVPGTLNLFGQGHVGGFFDQASNAPSLGQNKQFGVSLRADHDMGWAGLASITSWRHVDALGEGDQTDASVLSQYAYWIASKEMDASQEFQLSAPAASTLQWIGGIFLYSDKAENDPSSAYGYGQTSHVGNGSATDATLETYSYAGYGQATAPVADDTRFTLGLRYTLDHRHVTASYFDTNPVTGLPRIFNSANQQAQWGKMTYRLALDHNFGPGVLGYVSYNRGFKSGYFATGSPTGPAVNPEVLDAYEIGLKSDLLDHTLRLNVAAFYDQFHNIQIQQILTVNGTTTQVTLNAAQAEIKGIDFDAIYQPVANFTLNASVELLDTAFTSFPNAVYVYPCVTRTVAPACATSVNGGGYFSGAGNATGNELQFADPATANLTATYRVPTDMGDFNLIGTVAFHDGFYFDVQNSLKEPSYTLLNSSIMWTSPNGVYDVTLWGHNLTNVDYYSQYQRASTATTYSAQAPLTYGITLGYHWN